MPSPTDEQLAALRRCAAQGWPTSHDLTDALEWLDAERAASAQLKSDCAGLETRIENMGLTFAHSPLRERRDGEWFAEVPVGAFIMAMESWPGR